MKRGLLVLWVTSGLVLAACASRVAPAPGAIFSGPIEISGKASSGTLIFTVSGDGATITSVSVRLSDAQCDGMSARSMERRAYVSIPVADGSIDSSVGGIGVVEGRFTSPTEASGTIVLRLADIGPGQTTVCELGEWEWSAEAQEEPEWPWDDIPLYTDSQNLAECGESSPEAMQMAGAGFAQVEAWCFMTASGVEEVRAFYVEELVENGWTDTGSGEPPSVGTEFLVWERGTSEMVVITLCETFGGDLEVTVVRGQRER